MLGIEVAESRIASVNLFVVRTISFPSNPTAVTPTIPISLFGSGSANLGSLIHN